jgi:hypothetical protein
VRCGHFGLFRKEDRLDTMPEQAAIFSANGRLEPYLPVSIALIV